MSKEKEISTAITIKDLKNGVHIPSFKAKNIMYNQSTKTETYKKYNANIPFSLELVELFNILPIKAFWKKGKQVYTDAICNVNFDDAYYEQKDLKRNTYNAKKKKVITYDKSRGNVIMSQKTLRINLYNSGFNIFGENGKATISYVQFARTSAKAKDGDSWFIADKYSYTIDHAIYNHMINWNRLGVMIPNEKEIDLASYKAYEALPASSLIDTISIDPKHILIINDVPKEVTFTASVTTLDDQKNPKVDIVEDYKCTHDLWDGQGLISDKIIPQEYKKQTMLLLRERWLKCAAFSTDLEGFFRKKCEDEGRDFETATTKNMFGDDIHLKDIDLVITPNSLKLLKFAEFFGEDDYVNDTTINVEENKSKKKLYQQQKAFDYWVNNVTLFGICKQEHESKYGTHQKLTYQFINSLDITKEQLDKVFQKEREYIGLIKNDLSVFKHHINNNYVSNNKSFFINLIAVNDKAVSTQIAKDYRDTVVDKYIKSLKQGAIKVDNSDYCTLLSSPYSMLNTAYYGEYKGELIELDNNIEKGAVEVYSKRFKDGQYICGWRNPMINQGNVCYCKNVAHDEYKWFNLSNNIIIIRGDSNFVEINQGADEDSDTFCAVAQEQLVAIAKKMVQSDNYPIPINGIKFGKTHEKTLRLNNKQQSAEIDQIIADSSADIGIVCNWATVLNSLYWDLKSKGASQETLNKIYEKSSMCSSLSQICIDKSKKFFENKDCNVSKCLQTIYDLVDDEGNPIIKRIEIPVRKKNLNDDEANFVNEQLDLLKHKKITEDEFNAALDERLIDIKVKKKTGEIKEVWVSKPVRPSFFMYLDTGDKRQANDITKSDWNCPMNHLEKLLQNIDPKNHEKTTPLSKVIKKVNLTRVDYRQIQNVFVMVYEYKKKCNQLWIENKKRYKENKKEEAKYYDELLKAVRKVKINSDTIMQILYLCYDPKLKTKKTSVFKVTDSDGKEVKIHYSRQAMDTCGVLWRTHKSEFKNAYQMQKTTSTILEIAGDNTEGDIKILWGEKYIKKLA